VDLTQLTSVNIWWTIERKQSHGREEERRKEKKREEKKREEKRTE
jgi:hypothetical protein